MVVGGITLLWINSFLLSSWTLSRRGSNLFPCITQIAGQLSRKQWQTMHYFEPLTKLTFKFTRFISSSVHSRAILSLFIFSRSFCAIICPFIAIIVPLLSNAGKVIQLPAASFFECHGLEIAQRGRFVGGRKLRDVCVETLYTCARVYTLRISFREWNPLTGGISIMSVFL